MVPNRSGGLAKNAPLMIHAFALTPAWALTCYRLTNHNYNHHIIYVFRFQGQTVDNLLMHGHQTSKAKNMLVDAKYYYVAASRVRTLKALALTEPIDQDLQFYLPCIHYQVHDCRLALRTTQTRLHFAAAWRLHPDEVTALQRNAAQCERTLHELTLASTKQIENDIALKAQPSRSKRKKTTESLPKPNQKANTTKKRRVVTGT
jgi:hypothetical protein